MNKDKIIYELYKIIDDIDTSLDVFKTDYVGLQKSVSKRVKQRFFIPSDTVDELYRKYNTPPLNQTKDERKSNGQR